MGDGSGGRQRTPRHMADELIGKNAKSRIMRRGMTGQEKGAWNYWLGQAGKKGITTVPEQAG